MQAQKIEPLVWGLLSRYLKSPNSISPLLRAAEKIHEEHSNSSETKKTQAKLRSLDEQLETLSERLAQLPKSLSPTPILKQMEKIQTAKADEQLRLEALKRESGAMDTPAPIETFQMLLMALHKLTQESASGATRGKVIRTLVRRVEVTPEGYKMHYRLGRNYIEGALAMTAGAPKSRGSTSLTNGGSSPGTNELKPPTVTVKFSERWAKSGSLGAGNPERIGTDDAGDCDADGRRKNYSHQGLEAHWRVIISCEQLRCVDHRRSIE